MRLSLPPCNIRTPAALAICWRINGLYMQTRCCTRVSLWGAVPCETWHTATVLRFGSLSTRRGRLLKHDKLLCWGCESVDDTSAWRCRKNWWPSGVVKAYGRQKRSSWPSCDPVVRHPNIASVMSEMHKCQGVDAPEPFVGLSRAFLQVDNTSHTQWGLGLRRWLCGYVSEVCLELSFVEGRYRSHVTVPRNWSQEDICNNLNIDLCNLIQRI